MQPELGGFTSYNTFAMSEAGINLFLPWYILCDKQFTLQELTSHFMKIKNPKHLAGWLSGLGSNESLGYVRFRNLYAIYCGWELALASRYAHRIPRKHQRLYDAFGKLLHLGGYSVKKLRLDMCTRLSDA